jgi:hydrogenase/urease accessory protein HupE
MWHLLRIFIIACLCVFCTTRTGLAHLLPKQNATLHIVGEVAYFVVSVPVSAFVNIDDDSNGLLSLHEIQRHSEDIKRQFSEGFEFTDQGLDGTVVVSWVSPPHTDGTLDDVDYVVVLHALKFSSPLKHPTLKLSLFGKKSDEAQITISARSDHSSEFAVLTSSRPYHQFFKGNISLLIDFLFIGIEHIWTGFDHLLFLLTIVVVNKGWKYWLSLVTTFTIAHSITIALSAFDVLHLSSGLVEPAIAASISLMAVCNICNYKLRVAEGMRTAILIVFACGLLHGFGFASAVGEIMLNSGNRVITIAGFNLGIESGQFLFLGLVSVVLFSLRKLVDSRIANGAPLATSLVAAVLGVVMFLQRLDFF